MNRTATAIDITDLPEIRRIVEEAGGAPRVLQIDDEDVAILTPLLRDDERVRAKKEADDAGSSTGRS